MSAYVCVQVCTGLGGQRNSGRNRQSTVDSVMYRVCSKDSKCIEEEGIRFGIEKEFLNKSDSSNRIW